MSDTKWKSVRWSDESNISNRGCCFLWAQKEKHHPVGKPSHPLSFSPHGMGLRRGTSPFTPAGQLQDTKMWRLLYKGTGHLTVLPCLTPTLCNKDPRLLNNRSHIISKNWAEFYFQSSQWALFPNTYRELLKQKLTYKMFNMHNALNIGYKMTCRSLHSVFITQCPSFVRNRVGKASL